MYVVSGCKGRDLTLQGGVIHVTFMLQSSFFCLETKERSKEKFKADFFLLLAPFTSLKGRNSLRSNSLPFLTLRYGRSLDGEKSRPEDLAAYRPMQSGYSSPANMGSQAGSRIGFCFNTSSAFFDAYFVSTTRRNIYSLNQSSVMMRYP